MPETVIFTGSRDWTDTAAVRRVVDALPPGTVVVHGACGCDTTFEPSRLRGADRIADECARARGLDVRPVPARWSTEHFAAGPRRNRRMLTEYQPARVFAFPLGSSSGTRGMMQLAADAGVEVVCCDNTAGSGALDLTPSGSRANLGSPVGFSDSPGDSRGAGQGATAPGRLLYTIGYQTRTVDELLDELRAAEVDVVIDVRERPWSPAAQWRREELEPVLVSAGIRYAFAGDIVGNPAKFRHEPGSKVDRVLERFLEYVTAEPSRLERFGRRLAKTSGTCCLLCGCMVPELCHRHVIAEQLAFRGFISKFIHLRLRQGSLL